MKTYAELVSLPTIAERFEYLKFASQVGKETFGSLRYLNQSFYTSTVWKRTRRGVILRDNGCNMAHPDWPIEDAIVIHHINPITLEDLLEERPIIFDPENLVCVSDQLHKWIHYGVMKHLPNLPVSRHPGDTIPWR